MEYNLIFISLLMSFFIHFFPMLVLYYIKGPFSAKTSKITAIIYAIIAFVAKFFVCYTITIKTGYMITPSLPAVFFWGWISYLLLKHDERRVDRLNRLYETLENAEDSETIRLTILRIIKIEKRLGKKDAFNVLNKFN